MKKHLKQYFEWLFAGNVLTFNTEASQGKLVFEGHSKAFQTLLINGLGALTTMAIPATFIIFQITPPLLVVLFVFLMLGGFIAFGIGLVAMVYQPFWQHRKRINFTPQGIFTTNGGGVPINTKMQHIQALKVRFEKINPQVTHLQFWLNNKKRHFISSFFMEMPQTRGEIFDHFRVYAFHWGLSYYDISPSKSQNTGTFEFTRQQGKNELAQDTPYDQLEQTALTNQLQISAQPEIIAKYAFHRKNNTVLIQRRPGFKRRSWLFFLGSFLGGLGLLLLLILKALPQTDDHLTGIYVFIGCIAFLWIIFSIVSLNDVLSDFLVRVNKHQLYFQTRKNKGITIEHSNIQCLVIQGKIHQSRVTILNADIVVKLKDEVPFKNKPVQELRLLVVDSGRPEKLDNQSVRDAVYERSMRVARLIAQPLEVEVVWEGFVQ